MLLQGLTILVTRPQEQAAHLMHLLGAEGANPIWFAPIEICPDSQLLLQLPAQFLAAEIVFFVSPSAIEIAAPYLDFSQFLGSLVCVGKPSADKLQALSQHKVYYPSAGNDSEAVLDLGLWQGVVGKNVLIIKGEGGRTKLAQQLQKLGAKVNKISIYRRQEKQLDWDGWLNLAYKQHISAVCVTSSAIAQSLFMQAPKEAQQILKSLLYLTPHTRITQSLQQLGVTNAVTCKAGDENMVQSLITLLKPV